MKGCPCIVGLGTHVGTMPSSAQSTIKMVCRSEENLGRWDVCDSECAWLTFIHIICVHQGMFQISFEVMFYTLGKLLNNWSMLRMRRGKDKDPHMLSVLG